MSASDRPCEDQNPARPAESGSGAAVSPPNPPNPDSDWLERMQRARARHAAITRNLHTWANYKSWAEQVKDSWDEDPQKK